ncbi:fibronectin type III domain-containing protein [Listeria rocourtiae]|uniref:fibronectin type III domain-containing protein n=1 Tax=Listeria rocourtiae TaxID=647910 RepID=UPI001626A7CE|nr:fibronectin type III domain-containing protein [Listeria rocourtiae]
MKVSEFTDKTITWTWDSVEGASFYHVYVDGALIPAVASSNMFTSDKLLEATFCTMRVSAVSKYNVEGELSSEISQKTRLPEIVMERYIADSTYAKGKSMSLSTSNNVRVYDREKYTATGTIAGEDVSIYMTGIMNTNYAKMVSVVVNGAEKIKVPVNQDCTFRYYAKDIVKTVTDDVKVNLYNRNGTVIETLNVRLSNTSSSAEAQTGSYTNTYQVGSSYITGGYNNELILKALDGKSSGDPTTIEGMPTQMKIELPRLELNPISSVDKIVSGMTEPNGYVRLTVDGTARSVPQADATGYFTISNSSIISGSVILVESKVGSYYPGSVTATVPAPAGAPITPTNLAISDVTQTTAKLSWAASPGATSYKIYQNGYMVPWKSTSITSYSLTGAAGSSWTYQVSALNAAGESLMTAKATVNYLPE